MDASLLSASNEERRRAEAALEAQLQAAPRVAIEQLLAALRSLQEPTHLRCLAAVLLRRCVVKTPRWDFLDQSQRLAMARSVAEVLRGTTDAAVRRACADLLAAAVQADLSIGPETLRWSLASAHTLAGLDLLERLCTEASPVVLSRGEEVADALLPIVNADNAEERIILKSCAARCCLAWCIEAETEEQFHIGSARLLPAALDAATFAADTRAFAAAEFVLRGLIDLVDEDATFIERRSIVDPENLQRVFEFALAALIVEECRGPSLQLLRIIVVVFSSVYIEDDRLPCAALKALFDSVPPLRDEDEDWCISADHLISVADALEDEEHEIETEIGLTYDDDIPCISLNLLEALAQRTDMTLHETLGPTLRQGLVDDRNEVRRATLAAILAISAVYPPPEPLTARVAELAASDKSFALRSAGFDCLAALGDIREEQSSSASSFQEDAFFKGLCLHDDDFPIIDESGTTAVRNKVIVAAVLSGLLSHQSTASRRPNSIGQLYASRSACRALATVFSRRQSVQQQPEIIPLLTQLIATSRDYLLRSGDDEERLLIGHALLAASSATAFAAFAQGRRFEEENFLALTTTLVDILLHLLVQATTQGLSIALAFATSTCLGAIASSSSLDERAKQAFEKCATMSISNDTSVRFPAALFVLERGCLHNLARAALATRDELIVRNSVALACNVIDRAYDNTTVACKALFDFLRTTRGALAALNDFEVALRISTALGELIRQTSSPELVVFAASSIQRLFDDKVALAAALLPPDVSHRLVNTITPFLVEALNMPSHDRIDVDDGDVSFSSYDALVAIAEALSHCLTAPLTGAADIFLVSSDRLLAAVVDCAIVHEKEDKDGVLTEHLARSLKGAFLGTQRAVRQDFFLRRLAPFLQSTDTPRTISVHIVECFYDYVPQQEAASNYVVACLGPSVHFVTRRAAMRCIRALDETAIDSLMEITRSEDDEDRDLALAGLVGIACRSGFLKASGNHLALELILRLLPIRRATDWARKTHATFLTAIASSQIQSLADRRREFRRILYEVTVEQEAPAWTMAVLRRQPVQSHLHRALLQRHFNDADAATRAASTAYWLTQLLPSADARTLAFSIQQQLD